MSDVALVSSRTRPARSRRSAPALAGGGRRAPARPMQIAGSMAPPPVVPARAAVRTSVASPESPLPPPADPAHRCTRVGDDDVAVLRAPSHGLHTRLGQYRFETR